MSFQDSKFAPSRRSFQVPTELTTDNPICDGEEGSLV